jgi:hypothetical protein
MMKKFVTLFVLVALAALCAAPALGADARHEAYMKTAKAFVVDHKLPDGDDIMPEDVTEDFAENQLAFCDVDGDGKPELLINFQTGTMASMLLYACGFDEKAGKVTVKYVGSPATEFYNNGCAKDPALHNQGLGGDFWPYGISKYNPEKGEYDYMGNVDAWSKEDFPTHPFEEGKAYPADVDKTGDGFVYYIDDEHFKDAKGMETPVDTPVYEAWVAHYIGDAKPIEIEWFSADEKGLKALDKK